VLLIAALACVLPSFSQFADDFSDGDFTQNPAWTGNTDKFIVNAEGQLQLNDNASGQSILSTSFPSASLDNREWRIWVRQNFAGSDNNQSRIYLAANGAPGAYTGAGTAGVQGYFLKLGEGGSADAIKLCRDNGTGNITEIASGTASFIASAFTIRIKVTRDDAGLWRLFADPLAGDNLQLQATVTDLTYPACTHFGINCLYTSTNASKFFFDDIYFGAPILDSTPPVITGATATSASTLTVTFSETVDATSATQAGNYAVQGIGNATLAEMNGFNGVNLTFSGSFPSNVQQTLEVTGVTDLSGNAMPLSTFNFTWIENATGTYRSVVFNEVLADPSPVVGLPNAEYVELFNASDLSYNLQGWRLINTTTERILPTFPLLPGGHVILCDALNAPLFDPAVTIPITSFTALTNSADSLTLRNADNDIIDILSYSVSWYATPAKADGGWSLEQVNPYLPCSGSQNWKESASPSGGTPGVQNSVFDSTPDTQPPLITGMEVIDPTRLQVFFNETMTAGSELTASFEMFPGFSFSEFVWNNTLNALSFTISPELEAGIPYEFVTSGLTDCSGNAMPESTWELALGVSPEPGDVIINEIMPDPTPVVAGPADEYIEIYNRSNQLIDLKGCTINGDPFLSQTLIQPGGYLVVADESYAPSFAGFPGTVFLPNFPSLTNSGGELIFRNGQGAMLDLVNYSDTWYVDPAKNGNGWSLELINPDEPCSDAFNWRASVDPRGMTAGEQNSVYDTTPDVIPPVFQILLNEPFGAISLVFDNPIDEGSLTDIAWSIDGAAQPAGGVYRSPASQFTVVLPLPELEAGQPYTLAVSGFADCWGNAVVPFTATFAIPEIAQPGDLIINEILFNPFTPGQDFVEIYNRSERAISLQGWSLAGETANAPSDIRDIASQALVLLPGEYLVLTRTGHFLPTYYPFTRSNRIWIMPSMPTFNNGDGTCYLLMNDGQVSDVMRYTEDMHFPLLDDVKGVSLERIDFNRPSADLTNWLSASSSDGYATPGYLNSQAFSAGIGDESVSVTPEVFSPDNDGWQDVAVISYVNDRPGVTGSITIFNSEGLRVRRLMQNELLGREGQITWNGFGDEGETLGIGIYIIYFEAFDSDGRVSRIKKSCVLARPLGSN
jgi:hypothetical protein